MNQKRREKFYRRHCLRICAVALAALLSWRLTFAFDGTDAVLVDYQDYR